MSIIKCPHCRKYISSLSKNCLFCGVNINLSHQISEDFLTNVFNFFNIFIERYKTFFTDSKRFCNNNECIDLFSELLLLKDNFKYAGFDVKKEYYLPFNEESTCELIKKEAAKIFAESELAQLERMVDIYKKINIENNLLIFANDNWKIKHGLLPNIEENQCIFGLYPQSELINNDLIKKLGLLENTQKVGKYIYYDENFYFFEKDKEKWYVVKPIEWSVIEKFDDKKKLLVSKKVLLKGHYRTNFKEYLDNDFLNTAFFFVNNITHYFDYFYYTSTIDSSYVGSFKETTGVFNEIDKLFYYKNKSNHEENARLYCKVSTLSENQLKKLQPYDKICESTDYTNDCDCYVIRDKIFPLEFDSIHFVDNKTGELVSGGSEGVRPIVKVKF